MHSRLTRGNRKRLQRHGYGGERGVENDFGGGPGLGKEMGRIDSRNAHVDAVCQIARKK